MLPLAARAYGCSHSSAASTVGAHGMVPSPPDVLAQQSWVGMEWRTAERFAARSGGEARRALAARRGEHLREDRLRVGERARRPARERSRLDDRPREEASRLGGREVHRHRATARRLAEDGDARGVAAEARRVLCDPREGGPLVLDAVVARGARGDVEVAQALGAEEAVDVQPVVDRDYSDTAAQVGDQVSAVVVVRLAALVSAAVNPQQHRQLGGRPAQGAGRGEDVQQKTVFRARAVRLHAVATELGAIEKPSRISRRRLRRRPSSRGARVWDARKPSDSGCKSAGDNAFSRVQLGRAAGGRRGERHGVALWKLSERVERRGSEQGRPREHFSEGFPFFSTPWMWIDTRVDCGYPY